MGLPDIVFSVCIRIGVRLLRTKSQLYCPVVLLSRAVRSSDTFPPRPEVRSLVEHVAHSSVRTGEPTYKHHVPQSSGLVKSKVRRVHFDPQAEGSLLL